MAAFLAILSDVHANLDALEAVLADMAAFPVAAVVCLGDIVGYGPAPRACVERIRKLAAFSVLGNHEAMLAVAGRLPPDEPPGEVWAPLRLAQLELAPAQRRWLRQLPLVARAENMVFTHSSLSHPAGFPYIDSTAEADRHFAQQTEPIAFHGHTHIPIIWRQSPEGALARIPTQRPFKLPAKGRFAINAGSVGQPRDGDPRACYALYAPSSRTLILRRVPYDLSAAAARFREANLPTTNAARLALGE